jgi:5'-3' exoribonuclease 1
VVKAYEIPEFDNFYLDMNGIIHNCSHPNDDDPSFRISEDKIFNDIFHYLEVLFRIIKPKKVLFMAVDGVAPRAKMNQQRGRRFRSAKEAEEQELKALSKGIQLPTEARFDSNCITPGTAFMSRLHEQLKYFINQKLTSDPSWQKIEVIFSGHNVRCVVIVNCCCLRQIILVLLTLLENSFVLCMNACLMGCHYLCMIGLAIRFLFNIHLN